MLATLGSQGSTELLDAYAAAGSFFFGSRQRTLLAVGAKGPTRPMPESGAAKEISDWLEDVFIGQVRKPRILVGAVPFSGQGSELFIPEFVSWGGPLQVRSAPTPAVGNRFVLTKSDNSAYLRAVATAVSKIRDGELRKVVLARSIELRSQAPIDPCKVLRGLAARNPSSFIFALDLPPTGQGGAKSERKQSAKHRTLLGASPELLISRHQLSVVANPLAGSTPRRADPAEDWSGAHTLLRSEKNRVEHAIVVEDVTHRLRPFCDQLIVPTEPSLMQTGTMWHLSTRILGTLRSPEVSSLALAMALHPTPAVCGTPRGAAKIAIEEIESMNRGFYAGLIGWVSADGDGEWVICIRCGELEDRVARLYAGAGIVQGSIPSEELSETQAKFATFLSALGIHTLNFE